MLQSIISGLATGSMYALIAIGLVLVYKTTDIVNFAQGELAMLITFLTYTFAHYCGMPMPAAILLGLCFAFMMGVSVDKLIISRAKNAPELSIVIITIGLMMVINGVAGWFWGYEPTSFPTIFAGDSIKVAGAVISHQNFMNILIALIIMVGLYLLFKFTLVGIAMRSVAENVTASKIVGVPVKMIVTLTWGLAGVLAGLAGILIAPTSLLEINMMAVIILKAYTAAVFGGFNSVAGAIIGGIFLGVSENLIGAYVSTELKGTFAFLIIILVLMIKPSGLLGKPVQKKV